MRGGQKLSSGSDEFHSLAASAVVSFRSDSIDRTADPANGHVPLDATTRGGRDRLSANSRVQQKDCDCVTRPPDGLWLWIRRHSEYPTNSPSMLPCEISAEAAYSGSNRKHDGVCGLTLNMRSTMLYRPEETDGAVSATASALLYS
ncbi:hypothetical protein AXG93_763s1330 [Marchantia polymorpha subsp. ruderalis]|uniref:Uncharacterized protein n=1 Tax=Marchantia polymorpha subsp. ruderalis TaxID=1480154 RepID=A0A176WPS6_MARPO|nr:hypothetical protein AXG93_763s1330 [Marchantia polymorpha subsp. ruderalis]